jgi:hypothetical protein
MPHHFFSLSILQKLNLTGRRVVLGSVSVPSDKMIVVRWCSAIESLGTEHLVVLGVVCRRQQHLGPCGASNPWARRHNCLAARTEGLRIAPWRGGRSCSSMVNPFHQFLFSQMEAVWAPTFVVKHSSRRIEEEYYSMIGNRGIRFGGKTLSTRWSHQVIRGPLLKDLLKVLSTKHFLVSFSTVFSGKNPAFWDGLSRRQKRRDDCFSCVSHVNRVVLSWQLANGRFSLVKLR